MYTLAHLHVICRDMEKMIRFWREALGAEFVEYRTFGDDPGAIMRFGGLEIYFKEIPAGQGAAIRPGRLRACGGVCAASRDQRGILGQGLWLYAGVHARQSEPRRLRSQALKT